MSMRVKLPWGTTFQIVPLDDDQERELDRMLDEAEARRSRRNERQFA